MAKTIGIVILILGVVIALAGLAMPATETQTITSCVEGPRGIPNDGYCTGYESSATTEVPNTDRPPVIFVGLFLISSGGIAIAAGND